MNDRKSHNNLVLIGRHGSMVEPLVSTFLGLFHNVLFSLKSQSIGSCLIGTSFCHVCKDQRHEFHYNNHQITLTMQQLFAETLGRSKIQ